MRRPAAGVGALALLLAVALAGCGDKKTADAPASASRQQVTLGYQLPADTKKLSVPSATPTTGMVYDIRDLQQPNGCELRIVRLLLPRSDGSEDQDATYNMLGAVMKSSGITHFSTNGLMVPGTPGPVPALVASGQSAELALRAAGRVSNTSLQGFEVVYACPRGKLVEKTWNDLLDSLRVDGFTGSLDEH